MGTTITTEKKPFSPACGVFPQLLFASEEDLALIRKARKAARKPRSEMTAEDVLVRWPSLVSHVICTSLGYATPSCAARIVKDFVQGQENWCEWIYSCYARQPGGAVRSAIQGRESHTGYMADYKQALGLVVRAMVTGREPDFASWF